MNDEAKRESISRLTVVEKVYFQVGDDQPLLTTGSYGRVVRSSPEQEDQVYQRKTTIDGPIKLDLGWLATEKISLICIQNKSGIFLEKSPTPEEVEQEKKKELFICLDVDGCAEPFIVVPSGESCRFVPVDPNRLSLLNVGGSVPILITVFPDVPL